MLLSQASWPLSSANYVLLALGSAQRDEQVLIYLQQKSEDNILTSPRGLSFYS